MHFWNQLCGQPLIYWNENFPGHCFKSVILECPVYVFLTIVSAYYIGQQNEYLNRQTLDHFLLNLRISVCVLLLLCPSFQLTSEIFIYKEQVFIINYVVMFVSTFCWILHIRYLFSLRNGITKHIRGPFIVVAGFLLCFCISVFGLCSEWATWSKENKYLPIRSISLLVVIAQIIYLATLLPKLNSYPWQYQELWNINSSNSEQEPLISSVASQYGGFREDTDPLALGIAEESRGILSKIFLKWIHPLMQKGFKNQLHSTNDLYDLPLSLQASSVSDLVSSKILYKASFKRQLTDSSNAEAKSFTSLTRELHYYFKYEYYSIGLLKLASDCFAFGGPLLLNALVSILESSPKQSTSKGYYYAFGLFVTTFLGAIFTTHYNYLIYRVSLKIRAVLVTLIYQKTMLVNKVSLSAFNTGEILNFISSDTDRIVNFCPSFHQFWSLPVQVVITLYFLYEQVGYCFLVGLIFALIIIPINQYIARKIGNYSNLMMKEKDKRIKMINEILTGIRVIKMHTWERIFCSKLKAVRKKEILFLKKRKYLDAFCVYFWATTPLIISFLTFTTYVLLGNKLTPSKVFTSIALFNMLIMPLNAFPWVLNGLIEAWISLKRVNAFIKLPILKKQQYYIEPEKHDLKLEIKNGVFNFERPLTDSTSSQGLQGNQSVGKVFHLGPINLKLLQGKFLCIIGQVGSGKSSVLSSILADTNCISGEIKLGTEEIEQGIGLVSQDPWIQQASIKDNILFGKTLNTVKYRNVLEACALFEDLKMLPSGDRTEVGDKGVTLSGGQKARLSLARAIYQETEIYLLDDPLSAVDAHVAEHIFSNCIMGLLRNKTRILCTHKTQYVEKADYVIILSEGKVVNEGPPTEMIQLYFMGNTAAVDSKEKITKENQHEASTESLEDFELVQQEEKAHGVVKLDVYKSYGNAIGLGLSSLILIFCLLMQACRTLSDWWLSFWVTNESYFKNITSVENLLEHSEFRLYQNHSEKHRISFYLSVYGGLAAFNTVFTAFRAFFFAFAGIKAAITLHDKLLKNIIKATVGFFDVTPLGRILNRFSSDVFCIDDSLPFALNILLAQVYSLIGCLAVTCYGLPWILILILPLVIIYYRIQRYYRCTSRELKRLSSLSLSPIYVHFSETLQGHSTIKALSSSTRFQQSNMTRLDANQQAMFAINAASQWLNLRLQFIGVTIVTGVALIALIQSEFQPVDPGLVGLALSYALTVTGLLNGTVTAFTETEKEIVSVERVMQYIQGVKPEVEDMIIAPPFAWPSCGAITFEDVSLQYRAGCPYALKNVTFDTRPMEKLGIVGRTGSGKSSLIQALFRIVKINEGRILIDGVNISSLELRKLRSNISVIPQDPFLFSGTIRENIDPLSAHSEAEIWKMLKQCQIEEKIRELGGLDTDVEERGQNLSSGERQLICMTRVLLCRTKILCMDEATACLDKHTDSLVRHTLRMAFRHMTVLIVAHRTESVMDCDRILVMDGGRVVEMDKPSVLLSDPHSQYYKLVYGGIL